MNRSILTQPLGVMIAGLLCLSALAGPDLRIKKVLVQFVDKQGRTALSPSLFDRDAYQAQLRSKPTLVSSIVFKVQPTSNAKGKSLRIEYRVADAGAGVKTLETRIQKSGWLEFRLAPEDYGKFGSPSAWRVTIVDGDKVVAEQKSFLW